MGINFRIIIPGIFMILLMAGGCIYLVIDFRAEEKLLHETSASTIQITSHSRRLNQLQVQLDVGLLSYAFSEESHREDSILAHSETEMEIERIIDQLDKIVTSATGRNLLTAFIERGKGSKKLRHSLIAAFKLQDGERIDLAFRQWQLNSKYVSATLADFTTFTTKSLDGVIEKIKQRKAQSTLIMFLFVVANVIVIVLSFIYHNHTIIKPVAGLTAAASDISAGNFTRKLKWIESQDELGQLARAFDKMVKNLIAVNSGLEKKVKERTSELQLEIDQRKQVMESLRDSEEKSRAILETVLDGIITIDERGKIASFNQAAERLFGYRSHEVLGQNVNVLMPEPYRSGHDGYLRAFIESGDAKIIGRVRVLEARRKDGMTFPMELAVSEMHLDGRPMFTGIVRDITERKRADEALRESAAKMARAQRIAHFGNWDRDLVTDEIVWSDEVYRIFGHRPREFVVTFDAFLRGIHPDDREFVRQAANKAVAGKTPYNIEYRIVRPNGEVRIGQTQGDVEFDGTGKPIRLYGTVQDITERKQAERIKQKLQEQATQAQKIEALGTLAGGFAHDFNNSLFPIIGLTELTKAKLPEDSKEYHALSKVLVAAHHARDLVQQILAFSRQEPLNRRPVELQQVLSDALSFLRAGLPSTIKIEEHIHETPSFILADPTQIQQILINLGANARDAMQNEGGTLTVDLSEVQVGDGLENPLGDLEPGAYVRLEVTDTGCGMSEEMVARIFEPFFTTKEVGEGTGLGLSLVHSIVKNHDGALTVRSEPGHGTTFTVFLPALKTPIGELAPDEPRLEMEDIPSLSEF